MKVALIKAGMSVGIAAGVLAAYGWWYPWIFSLIWPSTGLARLGLPHTWVVTVALLVGGLIWLGVTARRRTIAGVVAMSAMMATAYALTSYVWVRVQPVPYPQSTRYDDAPTERAVYRLAFSEGYREALMGQARTFCFGPETETRGFYDGQYAGLKVWFRTFGIAMQERSRDAVETAAARDGVEGKTTP